MSVLKVTLTDITLKQLSKHLSQHLVENFSLQLSHFNDLDIFLFQYFQKWIFVLKKKMSKVESVNFCYICDLAFETKRQFIKQCLSDEHLNRARKEYEHDVEDETKEKVYDVEEDDYILKPKTITKDNTKDFIQIKTTTNTKAYAEAKNKTEDSIYTRIKYEWKKCHEESRNKIVLSTYSDSHNCKYLENREYFDINSSQNMKEIFNTDKGGNYIEDIDEAINNSLEEIKNCYQFRKVKNFKHKITAECEYKKRTKKKLKLLKYSPTLIILLITQYMNMVTSNLG